MWQPVKVILQRYQPRDAHGEGAVARPVEALVQVAGAVICLRGASRLEYKPPLTALVADLPCTGGARNAFTPELPLSHPRSSGLLRGSNGATACASLVSLGGCRYLCSSVQREEQGELRDGTSSAGEPALTGALLLSAISASQSFPPSLRRNRDGGKRHRTMKAE